MRLVELRQELQVLVMRCLDVANDVDVSSQTVQRTHFIQQAEGTKTKKQEVVNLGIVCRNCERLVTIGL